MDDLDQSLADAIAERRRRRAELEQQANLEDDPSPAAKAVLALASGVAGGLLHKDGGEIAKGARGELQDH
jgi:hypothetical protein